MNRRTIFTPQRYVPYRKAACGWEKFVCEQIDPPGLIVKKIDNTIGKGVFAGKKFPAGAFLMEYHGELISEEEGIKREKSYPIELGSFLLYFKSRRKIMCIDATFSNQCGRYVNDGIREKKNAELKVVYHSTTPHVILLASRNICKGEEIRYDYGVDNLPWRQGNGLANVHNEESLGHSVKECTVLLQKLDLGADTCVYEKEDGTEADVKISRMSQTELSCKDSPRYDNDQIYIPSTCGVKEMYGVNNGLISVALHQTRETARIKNSITPDFEMDLETNRDSCQVKTVNGHYKKTFSAQENRPQEQASLVKETDTNTDNDEVCVIIENQDAATNITTEGSVELTISNIGREEYTVQQGSLDISPLSQEHINEQASLVKETDTNTDNDGVCVIIENQDAASNITTEGSVELTISNIGREEYTVQQGSVDVSPLSQEHINEQASLVKETNTNTDNDGVCVIIENQDAASNITTEGSVELTISNIGREEYTVQQGSVDVSPFSQGHINEQASLVKETDTNINNDEVCVIIENQDAASNITTEGSVELTISNIGREEYTVQQGSVDVSPFSHEHINDSHSHVSKETPENPTTSYSQSKKRPYRPCPYCLSFKSALTKHLVKKHGDKTEVKEALKLRQQDRNRAFLLLKRKGIMMENMNKLRSEDNTTQPLLRERKHTIDSDVIYCSKCFGFFKKTYFYRHKKACHLNECSIYLPHAVQPETIATTNAAEEKFTTEILSSLNNDEVGQICKTDTVIVGYAQRKFRKLLTKQNVEKYEDKKTNIRTEMRRLGHLFKEFKQISSEKNVTCASSLEMFKSERFYVLEEAIDRVTIKEDGSTKFGLRKDIGYLIKRICKFLHGKFSVEQNIQNRDQVDSFLNVLTFFWSDIFGEAESALVYARQTQHRKPSKLPRQSDVRKLKDFMRSMIQQLTESDYDFIASSDFIKLRNLVVSRLTLFNARRGGEPCCLQINQWTEAENDVWIGENSSNQDPAEESLLGKYKIAYQTGKGEKLVSLLILDDCWKALRKLCDPEVREQAGVNPKNTYVFPRTQSSMQHVSGWEAVKECCNLAGLENDVNATGMRHYVATMYAGLDINESERETFYNHMGHSESVNKNVYQSPPARKTITKVGRFLHDVDKETTGQTSGEKQKGGRFDKTIKAVDSQSPRMMCSEVPQQDDDSDSETMQENYQNSEEDSNNYPSDSSKGRKQYRTWTREDTETVKKYFSSCILATENVETNKGSLPSVKELHKFLVEFPHILRDCCKREKIKRLRSKVFNERKLTREKMRETLRKATFKKRHKD